jgi:lysozyme family protein
MRTAHKFHAPSLNEALPIYKERWHNMVIDPHMLDALDAIAIRLLMTGKQQYLELEKETGVPVAITAAIHERESSGNFKRWLHNGDPMFDQKGHPIKTKQVPRGRPPNPNVSWVAGAIDAYRLTKMIGLAGKWTVELAAYHLEKFNGWGYWMFHHNVPAPYLWGWTNLYKSGSYTRDHHFDAHAVNHSPGAMPIIARMWEIDPSTVFVRALA